MELKSAALNRVGVHHLSAFPVKRTSQKAFIKRAKVQVCEWKRVFGTIRMGAEAVGTESTPQEERIKGQRRGLRNHS